MRLLCLVILTRLIFFAEVAAENGVNWTGLQYDQLFQTLVELTAKYAPLEFDEPLGELLSVSRDHSLQYCQQHVTRGTTLYVTYMATLYPRCYAEPHHSSTCPTLSLREYCFESDGVQCLNLTQHSINCFEDERLRVTSDEHVTRVAWVEDLRLVTNQLSADHVEIMQLAERAREAKISIDRVIDYLNERATRVKWSVSQIMQRLNSARMNISVTDSSQCELFLEQLTSDLLQISIARVEDDPVRTAVESVIDTLWHVTLCHSWQLDLTPLITCPTAFSEQCWNSFIAAHHLSRSMNDTRDVAAILRAWFAVPFGHVYFRCWSAQLTAVTDMLTAVSSLNQTVPPNVDISIGTGVSGSRDHCAYDASTRQLVRHEFDFDTFELRVTQLTANSSVPLVNVLSVDSAVFIALISNNTRLSNERPSGNFLPNLVVSFELQHEVSTVTPVTKRSTQASQCPAGQYLVLELGNLRCEECPRGSYCPGDDIKYLCHNAPLNVSDYTATGVTTEACPFSCHAGYYRLGDTCQTVPPGYAVSPHNASQLILCDTILPHSYYEFFSSGCEDGHAKYSAVLLPQTGYAWEQWVSLLTIIRHNFKLSTWLSVNTSQTQSRDMDITLLQVEQIWQLNLHLNLDPQCWARLELRGVLNSASSVEIPCPDTWQHIAVEGDLTKKSISFYVNGALSGTEYYSPWEYSPDVNGQLEAENSIYRPVFLMRVSHVTPFTDLPAHVHVTVQIDNLILAVAPNASAPYLETGSYTQLIDRWYHNPLENRVAQCQQQYEQIVLDSLNQPRCLPHCARDATRNLHVIDQREGVVVIDDVSPVNVACQSAVSANVSAQFGPRSLAHMSKVSKCDLHSVAQWSARYLVLTPVTADISIAEIAIVDARDSVVAIRVLQLINSPNMEVLNISSVNQVSRDQQLLIDLGQQVFIDRVYLFLATTSQFSISGHKSRDGTAQWHVSLTDPHAMQSESNPRATVLDERYRLPNQEISCVQCDAEFGVALSPRTSLSDCQCLNLDANIAFDIQRGCHVTESEAMSAPIFSISGKSPVASQKFALDFYFGQPAAWSLQLLAHVIEARDFIQVTVTDSQNRVTRVKYRLVSPPVTTATLSLPKIVRTNLTVTANWHRPGHVIGASATERYELVPQVPAVETVPKIDANISLTDTLVVIFRVSDTSAWPSSELNHVIVLTVSFMNGTSITSECGVTCQLVVTSSIHVRAVALKPDWLDSEARDWNFTFTPNPTELCDGYIWLCGLGFSVVGGGVVTAVILVLGWRLHWFKFQPRD